MAPEVHAKMVSEVAGAGAGHVQYIRYTAMGEPLLHPHLFDFLNFAKQHAKTTITLTTNGTLLTAEAALKLFDSGVDIIDVSLDAFSSEAYAKIRKGGTRDKTYAHVEHLLNERSRRNMTVKIVTTFIEQEANRGEAEVFKQFWQNAGADYVIIRRLHSHAGGKAGLADALAKSLATSARRPCLYPWERLSLNPHGFLIYCPSDWTHRSIVADFTKTGIADTWTGQAMQALRTAHTTNSFKEFPLCANCPDWAQTRWPHEGRSFADMVEELASPDKK